MKKALFVLPFFFSLPSLAGDLLTFKKLEKDPGFVRVYLEPARLKVDISEDGQTIQSSLLYRKDKQEATFVSHEKKQYTVFDKESMEKMAARMNSAMGAMKDAMARMPEGMQKMIKEKMGAAGGEAKNEPVLVRKVGSGEKVGKWSATRFEVVHGKKVVSDAWTVPFREVGVDQANFAVLKAMSEAFADLGKEFSRMVPGAEAGQVPLAQLQGLRKIEGFPVKAVNKNAGKKGERGFLLENAEKKSLSSSELAVPTGYEEKSFARM
jgi:hypothetical protein